MTCIYCILNTKNYKHLILVIKCMKPNILLNESTINKCMIVECDEYFDLITCHKTFPLETTVKQTL